MANSYELLAAMKKTIFELKEKIRETMESNAKEREEFFGRIDELQRIRTDLQKDKAETAQKNYEVADLTKKRLRESKEKEEIEKNL